MHTMWDFGHGILFQRAKNYIWKGPFPILLKYNNFDRSKEGQVLHDLVSTSANDLSRRWSKLLANFCCNNAILLQKHFGKNVFGIYWNFEIFENLKNKEIDEQQFFLFSSYLYFSKGEKIDYSFVITRHIYSPHIIMYCKNLCLNKVWSVFFQ